MFRALRRTLILTPSVLLLGSGYAQFSDDFSDGDFTSNPAWSGDDGLFTIDAGQLRSQSPGAANYQLSTPSTQATGAQWDFFINLKFSTSGANYADVYLMSDQADLSANVNGYFVRIGGTSDRVELFRSDAGTATSLIMSPNGIVNSSSDNPFRIEVKRDASDQWTLYYDDGALGSFILAGAVMDNSYSSCTHFGIRIEQSSAAGPINNHFFDDFVVGPIVVDTDPPQLTAVEVLDQDHVDALFNEPVDQATAEVVGNYDIQPFLSATNAQRDATELSRVHLTLSASLVSGNSYTLFVNNVEDLSGNAIVNGQLAFDYIVPDEATFRDVVINEIMADPTPQVGLPDAEFVEVFNTTSDRTFDLGGWTITDGSTIGTLPSVTLGPGAFAILTDDANAALFTGFGTVVSIPTFPSLNNDGDPLSLKDDNGAEIDAVTYALSWYRDGNKDDGGWTLEQINSFATCSGSANWIASSDPAGGTPGEQNSAFDPTPDSTPPVLESVLVAGAQTLILQFNETMDQGSLTSGMYTIDPSIAVQQAVAIAPDQVQLVLMDPLVVGTLYTITVADVTDCSGNAIGQASGTFGLPEPVEAGDVVINEVLYDPVTGGSDFVELYNRSQKVLSLADLQLGNVSNGAVANITPISQQPYLLFPGEYIALTEDPTDIITRYPLGHADRIRLADLPSYNNGSGSVILLDANSDQLERFDYDDDLHFALLNGTEGVSLERVDPDRAANDPSNWHSAAEAVGWATPGYENSQYAPHAEASGAMTIDPAIFSPDNDGYQDLLTIAYRFDEPGSVGSMTVFDIAGREVATLMENELLGTSGAISWDGVQADNTLSPMGPYVVYFEVYDLAGNTQKFRRTVVLAHKL
ncbi:MAG: lamin tail domain-containing protein [Flavobacteriales bacterium]|nr:lamin tail domain-containing protein [Flavobacteriales bacterium]MCB9166999.1 lamin tail domain-containing protein [Flavobacteriales bacterium]